MNVSRTAYLAVVTLVFLILVSQPVAAEPVSDSNMDVEEVVVVEDEGETRILLEYETTLSVRVGTFLFGSDALEEQVLDSVGIEESNSEFVSLGSESAEVLYLGDAEEISTQEADTVEFRG
jgi:hypothetical protein